MAMEKQFKLVGVIDNVSDYAIANGCVYYIVDEKIYPPVSALNEVIERKGSVNKFRLKLIGFGSILQLDFGNNSRVSVDVKENKILYVSNSDDYRVKHWNADIPDTCKEYTVLYSKESADYPLGMRNTPLQELGTGELRTIERATVSQLNNGQYLFSEDKGRNILNRIDAKGLDVWQVQAEGQYESVNNQVLFRNGITALIGITDNILWYGENSGAIIGIDIDTGEVLHRINEPGSGNYKELAREDRGDLFRIKDFRLSPDKTKIIALQFMIYAEIDLKAPAPQIEAYPLDRELKNKNINLTLFHKMSISGGKVLFHNATTNSELIFGIFNTKSRSVISFVSLNEHVQTEPIHSCMLLHEKYYIYFGAHANSAGKLVVLEQRDKSA